MITKSDCPFEIWVKKIAVTRIYQTIMLCNGSKTTAARRLGISRKSLYRWLDWDEKRQEFEKHQVIGPLNLSCEGVTDGTSREIGTEGIENHEDLLSAL
jgi:hypothetical protein